MRVRDMEASIDLKKQEVEKLKEASNTPVAGAAAAAQSPPVDILDAIDELERKEEMAKIEDLVAKSKKNGGIMASFFAAPEQTAEVTSPRIDKIKKDKNEQKLILDTIAKALQND